MRDPRLTQAHLRKADPVATLKHCQQPIPAVLKAAKAEYEEERFDLIPD